MIAAGEDHTVALTRDGRVLAWGNNRFGQSNVPENLSAIGYIGAGGGFTFAIDAGRSSRTRLWGRFRFTPAPPSFLGAAFIDVGVSHMLASSLEGTVEAWGKSNYGQSSVLAELSGVTSVAAGGEHSVILRYDGTLEAWGYNGYGQSDVPPGLSGVTSIDAGAEHSVAVIGTPERQAPPLTINIAGNDVILTWPVFNGDRMQLECSTEFANGWSPVADIALNNDKYMFTEIVWDKQKFYRLRRY